MMIHGAQYKGKTTSLLGQSWSQSPRPHLFSALLESSGMDLPARKPGHPWSWSCLPPGEHRREPQGWPRKCHLLTDHQMLWPRQW